MTKFMQSGDKHYCCGCAVCMYECTSGAIQMVADDEGFIYPRINKSQCIGCGKCNDVCPMINRADDDEVVKPMIYAFQHKNNEVRERSQSGGLFTAVSDVVLANGGVVYGAAFDDKYHITHQEAETKEKRNEFCGSKYVQSDLQSILQMIKRRLQAGREVLFSGTPCQCSAIGKLFSEYNNLYLCDVICHGTPSPKIWTDYLAYKTRRYGQRPVRVMFRNKKDYGWHSHVETIIIGNRTLNDLLYTQIFYSSNTLRPSCYKCPFARMKRPSDITMGDFWGINEALPDYSDDNKGVSMALINTSKGRELLRKAMPEIDIIEYEGEKLTKQPQLYNPTACPETREGFWYDYKAYGFPYIAKKYSCAGFPKKRSDVKALLIRLGFFKVNHDKHTANPIV